MRALGVFASALAFRCPLNAVGFPSLSPSWTVSNLASINSLRFDYPRDSRSVEWLIRGPVLGTDMVYRLLRRDALRAVIAVQVFSSFRPSNFDPKRKVRVQNVVTHMLADCGYMAPPRMLFRLALRRQRELFSTLSLGMAVRSKPFCLRSIAGYRRSELRVACGHAVLDVAIECSQQKCAKRARVQCI